MHTRSVPRRTTARSCLPSGSWSVLQCNAIGAPSYCADDKILNDPRQGVASSFAISLTCADNNHYLIATRHLSRRQQSGYGYRLLRGPSPVGKPLKVERKRNSTVFRLAPAVYYRLSKYTPEMETSRDRWSARTIFPDGTSMTSRLVNRGVTMFREEQVISIFGRF